MELYERQQFDFLLMTAVERFVERIEQRNEGATNALRRLRADRDAPGIWMTQFVDAIFEDFLVNNLEGACSCCVVWPRVRRRCLRPQRRLSRR